jgi:hypothetical protein
VITIADLTRPVQAGIAAGPLLAAAAGGGR